jgi:peptidoglycan/LPS O-acetylase OafA/YrhL
MKEKLNLFYSIQALRYFAAILVILFHLGINKSGYKGVDLFFVISGFVVFYRYNGAAGLNAGKRRQFFVNRVTKIFLLYWVALLVWYFAEPFVLNEGTIKTIFLIPGHEAILPVSWSLSYELYFYTAFGVSSFIGSRRSKRNIFVIIFAASAAITITGIFNDTFKGSLINFLLGHNFWEFLLGILSGYLFTSRTTSNIFNYCFIAVSFACFLAADISFGAPVAPVIYGLCAFGIVYSLICIDRIHPFRVGILNLLGQSSYAIYLFAPVFLLFITPVSTIEVIISISVITLLSILLNKAFEEPVLTWLRNKVLGGRLMKTVDPVSFP